MVHIKIKKGLDIPIIGSPQDHSEAIVADGHLIAPQTVALNLNSFEEIRFRLLVKQGDVVKLGQPLVEDKASEGRYLVAPGAGIVKEIRRGAKRVLLDIVIELAQNEEIIKHPTLDPRSATREQLIAALKSGGLFAHIRKRPFNTLANPEQTPRCIFVKAIESAPFSVPAELQVQGYEQAFQAGLTALSRLTDGPVHLVYRQNTSSRAFYDAQDVVKHTAEGPHPIGSHSVHIHFIAPVQQVNDVIWTLNVKDVIGIGVLLTQGTYYTDRVVAIGGPGVVNGHTGFYRARAGFPISGLIAGRLQPGLQRLISGDVLTGRKVDTIDYLGFEDEAFCIIPENTAREFLHFFRLGIDKYTASKTYLSGHLSHSDREYFFNTSQHGEQRPFVIGSPYENVMPLPIPTIELVKAVQSENYDLASELGLLEVIPEDFALPVFVDPCKIDMMGIIQQGQKVYARDMLG